MNEQLIQQYLELIQELLGCPNGEKLAILEAHTKLLDAGLLTVMAHYSQYLRQQGQDNAAQWLEQLAQELQPQIVGATTAENSDSWDAVNQQVMELYQQGNYGAAIPLAQQAVEIARQRWGDRHPKVAISLNNLALLYNEQSKDKEAEPLYHEAIAIDRIALPQNHPHLATHLNNLALLYEFQGKDREAEPLYHEAIAIDRIALPKNHPSLATHLNNLANLYYSQGKYEEAERRYHEAYTIDRIALPKNHPSLATDLNNLAELYRSQGKYEEAERRLNEAIAIDHIALPKNHPHLATHLNNLANLYYSQSKYEEAERRYHEALDIVRIALPQNHPYLASTLNNLAELYRSQGKYKEVFQQFQASLESENLRLRYVFSTSSDRERREYLQKNPSTYYLFLNLIWQHLRDDSQAVGAALDAVLRRKALTTAALAAQSAAIYSGRYSEEIKSLFRDWQQCLEELKKETFKVIIPQPNESSENYQQRLKERRDKVTQQRNKAEILEKQLAEEIPELQLNQENLNRQVIAEQLPEGSALVEFVRFRRCDFNAPKEAQWQEDRYLAFAVMAHQPEQVRLLDLGKAKPLDELIEVFRSYVVSEKDRLRLGLHKKKFAAQKAKKQLDEQQQLYQLYQTLCQPLINALDSASHWFLAPDSTLNLLPFQILPLDITTNKPYLGDEYRISYLSAGRDLLRLDITERPLKVCPATILADPDYNWDGKKTHPAAAEPSQGIATASLETTVATLSGFTRAEGTDIFGRRVGELLDTQPHLDKDAVSYHLTDGDCPRILVIATHGFAGIAQKAYIQFVLTLLEAEPGTETNLFEKDPYLNLMNRRLLDAVEEVAQYFEAKNPQITQRSRNFIPQIQAYLQENPPSPIDPEEAEDAMYRAGIALAGANIWNQGKPLPEGMKGILFAQDVATLDLWGNELSALIACKTGLGEISYGEGVFGLRRAFVVAGSKTLLMSLWSVPARATAYLMERFFHHLKAGLGRAEALAQAQFDVRTVTAGVLRQSDLGREILQGLKWNYGDEGCPLSHPYYWGAWICQGDISPLQVELYGELPLG
ncbi:MAG: tetratricopeptide repeat protein [Hormoscilla sp.]